MKHLFDSLSDEYNTTSMDDKIEELKRLIQAKSLLELIDEASGSPFSKHLALIDYLNELLQKKPNP